MEGHSWRSKTGVRSTRASKAGLLSLFVIPVEEGSYKLQDLEFLWIRPIKGYEMEEMICDNLSMMGSVFVSFLGLVYRTYQYYPLASPS